MSDSDEDWDLFEDSDYANVFYWNQFRPQEDRSSHPYEAIPTSSAYSWFEPLLQTSDEEQDFDDRDSYDLENLFHEEESQSLTPASPPRQSIASIGSVSPVRQSPPKIPGEKSPSSLSVYESQGARPKVRTSSKTSDTDAHDISFSSGEEKGQGEGKVNPNLNSNMSDEEEDNDDNYDDDSYGSLSPISMGDFSMGEDVTSQLSSIRQQTTPVKTYESGGARPKARSFSSPKPLDVIHPIDPDLEAKREVSKSPYSPAQLPISRPTPPSTLSSPQMTEVQGPGRKRPPTWHIAPGTDTKVTPFEGAPSSETLPQMTEGQGPGRKRPPTWHIAPGTETKVTPFKGPRSSETLSQQLFPSEQRKTFPASQTSPSPPKRVSPRKEFGGSEGESGNLERIVARRLKDLGSGAGGEVWMSLCIEDIKVKVPCDAGEGEEFSKERNCHVKTKSLEGENVAVKWMSSQIAYDKEMRILCRVNHPNCIIMYDAFKLANNYYILMEYLDGGTTLAKFLQQQIDDWTALLIIKHITSALEYLHSIGICHHDLHAGNIMPHTEDGQKIIWKIIDFGTGSLKGDSTFDIEKDLVYLRKFVLSKTIACNGVNPKTREDIEHVVRLIPDILDTMTKIVEALRDFFEDSDDPPEGSASKKYLKEFEE